MKTPPSRFLTAPRLSIGVAIVLTIALLFAAPFVIPRLAPNTVKADSTADVSSGDFESQSRHYTAEAGHKGRKPSPAKLKKPRVQPQVVASEVAGN